MLQLLQILIYYVQRWTPLISQLKTLAKAASFCLQLAQHFKGSYPFLKDISNLLLRISSYRDLYRSHEQILSCFHIHRKVPPKVGVQKSTVVSCVTGNVLDIGTKHSPRLLKSCLDPSKGLSKICISRVFSILIYNLKKTTLIKRISID